MRNFIPHTSLVKKIKDYAGVLCSLKLENTA